MGLKDLFIALAEAPTWDPDESKPFTKYMTEMDRWKVKKETKNPNIN